MVIDVKPIPNLCPISIKWNVFTMEHFHERQWDEFFWVMPWAVIVRAIADDDRQPVGVVPSTYKMI